MTILKKTDKKELIYKILSFFLMVGWICFIFSLSLQPATQSSAVSKGLLTKILYIFYHITKIQVDVLILHNLFRSFAHFTEFFILGIFSLLFYFSALKKRPVYAIITGLAVALCDEMIQFLFAEGRAMQFSDIIIDFSGVILSTVIFYLFYKFAKK